MLKRSTCIAALSLCSLTSLLVACFGEHDPSTSSPIKPASTTTYSSDLQANATTETPRSHTNEPQVLITVPTVPGATCTLSSADGTPSAHPFVVTGSYEGLARFYGPDLRKSQRPGVVSLDCDEHENGIVHHTLDLRADETFAVHAPPVKVEPIRVRPPLIGDLASYSTEFLRANGYPRRPGDNPNTKLYQRWAASVTKPVSILPPALVTRSDLHNHPSQQAPLFTPPPNTFYEDGHWCGIALHASVTYIDTFSSLTVPTWQGDGQQFAYVSMWNGMDGWLSGSDGNVLQDGVAIQIVTISYDGTIYTFANYYPWVEYYPNPTQEITSIYVGPGDLMIQSSWACNSETYEDASGGYGCYDLYNDTTAQSATAQIAIPSGQTFEGASAEFIFEKAIADQAMTDFGTEVDMSGGAYDTNDNFHDQSDPNDTIWGSDEGNGDLFCYCGGNGVEEVTYSWASPGE